MQEQSFNPYTLASPHHGVTSPRPLAASLLSLSEKHCAESEPERYLYVLSQGCDPTILL